MKILFYAINGIGLGHVVRTTSLATAIRKISRRTEILFVTNTRFPFFLKRNKIPFSRTDFSWVESVSEKRSVRTIKRLLREADPDAVVYDTVFPERALRDPCSRGRTNVLILRERGERTMRELFSNSSLWFFDRIIIPHARRDFAFDLPADLRRRARFVGPIIRDYSLGRTREMAKKYRLRGKFVITVTCGGGGHPVLSEIFVCAVVGALQRLRLPDVRAVVVTGPLFRKDMGHLEKNILLVSFEPDLPSLIKASNLVICEAGYNTINEVIKIRTPAVILPAKRQYDDQFGRARRLEERGAVVVVPRPEPDALRDAVLNLYRDRKRLAKMRRRFPVLRQGNEVAAKIILEAARQGPAGRRDI